MPFDKIVADDVIVYVTRDIANEAWHVDFFRFVSDPNLAKRLAEEFISTRCMYKILEGLSVTKWMLRAQVRQQIMSYASIYEAAIHHLLFRDLATDPAVIALMIQLGRSEVSIPKTKVATINSLLFHNGKKIYLTCDAPKKIRESAIRFDKKAQCARDLGFITPTLCDELIEFYEARNAIHIHAEIRKSMRYQIDLSWRAYRRMEAFKAQVEAKMVSLGLVPAFPAKPPKSRRPKPSVSNTALP